MVLLLAVLGWRAEAAEPGVRPFLWAAGTPDGRLGTTSNLYRIDPETGAATLVGPIGFRVTGLATHPDTGVLYGSVAHKSATAHDSLITIDRLTGAGTLVGAYGSSSRMADIAFIGSDDPPTLVGWNEGTDDDLWSIDTATGAATIVGDAGIETSGSGLAWCESSDAVYLAPEGGEGRLFLVDPSDGSVASQGNLTGAPFNGQVAALTCQVTEAMLYGALQDHDDDARHTKLVRIDPRDRVVHVIGDLPDLTDGLGFDHVRVHPLATPDRTFPGVGIVFRARAETPSGTALTWAWDFGDGETATTEQPTHAYAAAGTYTVRVTVTDATGAGAVGVSEVTVVTPVPGGRQFLWGVDGADGHRNGHPGRNDWAMLYRIDLVTGGAVPAGPVGFALSGLAVQPGTGTLFGCTSRAGAASPDAASLVTVDRATGAATLVGEMSTGNAICPDLAFAADGTLYAWNERGDALYQVDPATAAIALVGSDPGISTWGSGLAFGANGTLYAATEGQSGKLYGIDTTTGAATSLGLLTPPADIANGDVPIASLDRAADGRLVGSTLDYYGASGVRRSTLVAVDPVTLTVTELSPTTSHLDAVAFEPQQAPTIDGVSVVPNPAGIGQTVTFTATATPARSYLAIADYAWTFGDGASGSGSPATHAYAAAGTWAGQVTVTDDNGASSAAQAVEVLVVPGFTVKKLQVALNFKKAGRDTLGLKGAVALPAGIALAGRTVTLDVGVGATTTFGPLNAKGKAKGFALNPKNGKLTIRLQKASLASALADDGLVDATVKKVPVTVPVLLGLGDAVWFQQTTPRTWTAKAGRTGKAK